jgi:hypothetical protein
MQIQQKQTSNAAELLSIHNYAPHVVVWHLAAQIDVLFLSVRLGHDKIGIKFESLGGGISLKLHG